MADETIVAVFDSASEADAAIHDLEAAGVPSNAITRHMDGGIPGEATTGSAAPPRQQGFWASLFGGEPEHDTAIYDRSVESGASVVTVRSPDAHVARVTDVLERHNPVDLNERASTYGLGTMPAGSAAAGEHQGAGRTDQIASGMTRAAEPAGAAARGRAAGAEGETIQLAEEVLAVGKRLVNRGTTRIHRFVTEVPVEQQVTLHDEKVSIERHPVSDGRPVTDADFSDKVIEVAETGEEAVVGKTARVREEVSIGKTATDRTETVRDTVRREDVEIQRGDGGDGVTGRTAATGASGAMRSGATTQNPTGPRTDIGNTSEASSARDTSPSDTTRSARLPGA